jgi:signal transduction histidine kinase
MIPALIMVVSFPVIPLLWSGLEVAVDAPLHQYLNVLPQILQAPWLQQLSTLTLLFVSVSLLVVIAMALGKIMLVCFAVNTQRRFETDMDQWLFRRHALYACLWLVAALGFSMLSKSSSITDLSIAGMIGMIQLLPALVGTLYVPNINSRGVLAGLLVGTGLWLTGIVSYIVTGQDSLTFLGSTIMTGPGNWPFWLLESLVANLLVTLIVSLLTKTPREEKRHAYLCLVDSLPTPQRQSFEIIPLEQLRQRLSDWIGPEAAAREITLASKNIRLSEDDHRPLAMRLLRDRLGFQLSGKLGTLKSEEIVEAVMPTGSNIAIDDITLLESQLASSGGELSGLAADLNKLRLFHRKTLENLPIGVCSLDPSGEVILWNLSMAQITGIKAADAEGAQFRDIRDPWGKLLDQFCRSPSDMWPAHEVQHPDNGLSWYHMTKHRADETSHLYAGYQVVLMEDISDRLRLVQELAHAERLTSVGRLAAGVAHEIGNPVTGISCIAQDLIAESEEQETREYGATILDLTNRISIIVRTLMDFSRSGGDILTLSPVRLKTAVEQAIQLLRLDKSAKTVEFNLSIADDLRVMGDLHQLTQVFVNLLVNSRDASPAGSRIDVTCEQGEDNQLTVHVADDGSGIPEDILERVMDPFFTTKDPGAGTGLGLSLVYSIVRLHKGTIKITSPVVNGRGTKVSITLTTPLTSDWLATGDD